MPALYPNTPYTAEDQLSDLVYGASDYQDPNKVMPTAGIAGGYSSMAPAPAPAAEPAAQYPPTSPPPADANYVAQPQPQATGPDPFAAPYYPATGDVTPNDGGGPAAAQMGTAPPTAKASLNYHAEPINATNNPGNIWGEPEWDAVDVVGNVGWNGAQQQPWRGGAAPLTPPNPAPYTGPNYLSEPQSGDLATMPSLRGYGGANLDQLQRRVGGRQVAPAYPPTEPTVTQLPRTGEPGFLPTPTPTPPTLGRRADVVAQTGGDTQAFLRDLYGPTPTQGEPSTLGTVHPDPFLDYRRSTSDIMTLPPPSQGANLGEGWLGGWDGLTAESRPTGDWWESPDTPVVPPPDDLTTLGTATADADWANQALTGAATPPRSRWGLTAEDAQRLTDTIATATRPFQRQSGGEVGGASAGGATPPGATPAPAKQPAAMWVLAPDGGLADVNDAGSAVAGLGDTGLPTLGVLNMEADGSITLNTTVAPKASLDAAAQRGEKAVALSNAEFDAIVAAGLMTNGDGSALTPEQVEVWRSALVGQPMLAPAEWMPHIADPGAAPANPEVVFTPEAAPVAAADTSSSASSRTWNGGYSNSGYSRGGGYARGGGYSRGGGGGSWYDQGGSYPPTMPEGMADFFGPDAFDSPIFARVRGLMGSRRRGRRRGRRGMPMMMPGLGRGETPSRDVNLTVQGPVVNASLARALAMRDR